MLKFDASRLGDMEYWGDTGVFVRGQYPDLNWGNQDMVMLDKPSLLEFLRSRGGENEFAEDIVGILLGHGKLNGD